MKNHEGVTWKTDDDCVHCGHRGMEFVLREQAGGRYHGALSCPGCGASDDPVLAYRHQVPEDIRNGRAEEEE